LKEKGEIGCGIAVLVVACVAAAFLLSEAPWLMLALPTALALLFIVFDIFRDDVFLTAEQPGGFTAWHAAYLTSVRRVFGKPPILVVPESQVSAEERKMVKRAAQLAAEVRSALRHSPISELEKAPLARQADAVPANIANALWRLARLRRVRKSSDTKTDKGREKSGEIKSLEQQVLAEIEHSLDVLAGIPISLVKVELARDDRRADQLLADLGESNARLEDVSSAYQEMRSNETP
jgi:hypothetical protein